MSKNVVLITGASRGIGLQLAKDYTARGNFVIATARSLNTANELVSLQEKHRDLVLLVSLDVTSTESIAAAASEVASKVDKVDVLINNAGVLLHPDDALQPDLVETLKTTFNTNTVAALAVTQAFLPLLSNSFDPRVVNVSSILGSNASYAKTSIFASTSYRVSKAGLNMLTRALAAELGRTEETAASESQRQKPIFVAVCPGWVQTDMGKSVLPSGSPPLTVEESSSALVKLIDGLTAKDNGAYLNKDGPIDW